MKNTTLLSTCPRRKTLLSGHQGRGLLLLTLMSIVLEIFASSAWPATQPEAPFTSHVQVFKTTAKDQSQQIMAVLFIVPKSEWYFYTQTTQGQGKPTKITANNLLTQKALPVYYPPGQEISKSLDKSSTVYISKTPFFVPLPQSGQAPDEITLSLQLDFLLCSDRGCWPVEREISFTMKDFSVAELSDLENTPWHNLWTKSSRGTPQKEKQPKTPRGGKISNEAPEAFHPQFLKPDYEVHGLGKAIILALIAGLILNVMPCVLPVLSLKLRSLIPYSETYHQKEQTSQRYRQYTLLFSLGIISYFLILAVIFSLSDMVWGEMFQHPLSVIVLIAVVFALSLSLFGLYDLPVIDVRHSSGTGPAKMSVEAYATGFLVTLLATPCSGPLLGGVLAWSLTQPAVTVGVVFACIGLGMSLPYIGLSIFPHWIQYFPKPGAWTQTLEQVIGFFLIATCLYLLSLLPGEYLLRVFVLLWFISLGAWTWGRFTNLQQSCWKRWGIRSLILATVFFFGLGVMQNTQNKRQPWIPFSTKRFEHSLGREKLLLEFTAPWCPNCKFLEKTVLSPSNIEQWRKKYHFTPIRVDLSQNQEEGKALLESLGSRSIPMVALFPQGKQAERPLVIRDMFTTKDLEGALKNVF